MSNIFGDMPGEMGTERDQWLLKITRNGEVMATVNVDGYDLKKPAARSGLVHEIVSELCRNFVRRIAEPDAE